MRVIDYHMHTHFSGDSEANPREHVLKAIEMNLDEICFTDHRDFDYPIDSFELDVENYYQEIQSLKEEFKDQIKIKWGIEMGLDKGSLRVRSYYSGPYGYVGRCSDQ